MAAGSVALSHERLAEALKALDPVSRSLLDLSLRRGIPDDDIAQVVGTEAGRIADRRDEVLRELAAQVGLEPAPEELVRVREALKELDWRSRPRERGADDVGPPGAGERSGRPMRPRQQSDAALARAKDAGRNPWVLLAAVSLSALVALRRRPS